jgi:hypothetical protein
MRSDRRRVGLQRREVLADGDHEVHLLRADTENKPVDAAAVLMATPHFSQAQRR